jgi:hypothetical protein
MSEEPLEPFLNPPRKTIYSSYHGPKAGLGAATRLLYSWVGTYFPDRVEDVTVCFADRAALDAERDAPIDVEVRFDVDEWFNPGTVLPQGLQLKRMAGEALLLHTYRGPLTGLNDALRPWLAEAARRRQVAPGYRQRMVRMAQRPDAPDWEVEVALVLL